MIFRQILLGFGYPIAPTEPATGELARVSTREGLTAPLAALE
jgi:hypothetical protein